MEGLPELRSERLILRGFALADAERVQALAGDPEVALMTSNIPYPYETGLAEAWISSHAPSVRAGRELPFAVELRGVGLIGATTLFPEVEHGRAELGYWIGRSFWGQGFATEACIALLRYGFDVLTLRRVYARCLMDNVGSQRVLEKLGMRREGVLRQHDLDRSSKPADISWYGILAEEFAFHADAQLA